MPQIDLEQDLGEISRECSFQILKHFSRLDILPWNASPKDLSKTNGRVEFLRYDPLTTTFRTLPDAPRRFQGALKVGLLTGQQAHLLSTRLLEFCRRALARYDGHYSLELGGKIARMVRHAAELQDSGLLEIDRDFLPDDLYAAMPWASRPDYFGAGEVKSIPVRENLVAAPKQPFTALGIAIDAVCSGPSAGLKVENIFAILDLLGGRDVDISTTINGEDTRIKIVIPSVAGGFQGITIGNFINCSDAVLYRLLNPLQQYGETIGHKCEEIRHHRAAHLLENNDGLEDVAKAFLTILPPVNRIIAVKGKECAGLELRLEDVYWAGYAPMSRGRVAQVQDAKEYDEFLIRINGDTVRMQVQLVEDLPSLNPVLTRFRMKSNIARVTSSLAQGVGQPIVRRSELLLVHESLERQIAEGVKIQSACKALYVVDAMLKNYDEGETRIHNGSARAFITKRLGRPAVGYQVAGKSSDKLIKEINRLIRGVQFEAPTNAVLRARWRPADSQFS
jgi:hypothetical protein